MSFVLARRRALEALRGQPRRSVYLDLYAHYTLQEQDNTPDAMKRRGYIIYAGQGDLRTYAFRISNLGILTPEDMEGVVSAIADCLRELGLTPP